MRVPLFEATFLASVILCCWGQSLVPQCPQPGDGGPLNGALGKVKTVIDDAGSLIPGIGKVFDPIFKFFLDLIGMGAGKQQLLQQIEKYIQCEIADAVIMEETKRLGNEISNYQTALQRIDNYKQSGTPDGLKQYYIELMAFVDTEVDIKSFTDLTLFQSNIGFLRHIGSIHMGAHMDGLNTCLHLNLTDCGVVAKNWILNYNKYVAYANKVVPYTIQWRLSQVKLHGLDCYRFFGQVWILNGDCFDSFTQKEACKEFRFNNCDRNGGPSPALTAANNLLKGYQNAVQAQLVAEFKMPIADWNTWYTQVKKYAGQK